MNAFVTFIGKEAEEKAEIINVLKTMDVDISGEDTSLKELKRIFKKKRKGK